MTFDEIVRARRSVRRYKPDAVEPGKLRQVLEAGRLAPSAKNAQQWRFTVLAGEADRVMMEDLCLGQAMVRQAPLNLVVWAESDREMACGHSAAVVDCSIALSFMVLKATELGLGTCWLGAFNAEAIRRRLRLPEDAVVVAVTPLGYPDETPAPRPRVALEEIADIREGNG